MTKFTSQDVRRPSTPYRRSGTWATQGAAISLVKKKKTEIKRRFLGNI